MTKHQLELINELQQYEIELLKDYILSKCGQEELDNILKHIHDTYPLY